MECTSERRKCPECSSYMRCENHKGVNIDRCTNCGGVFLDFGEMKEIIENSAIEEIYDEVKKGDFTEDNIGKSIKCSKCGSIMEEREYVYGSGNHINFCKDCGSIYLDKGELKDVVDFEHSRVTSSQGDKLLKEMEMKGRMISMAQKGTMDKITDKEKGIFGMILHFLSK